MSDEHKRAPSPEALEPGAVMRAQMTMAMRDLERRFPSLRVGFFIFPDGAALHHSPEFNFATNAPQGADFQAVVGAWLAEQRAGSKPEGSA